MIADRASSVAGSQLPCDFSLLGETPGFIRADRRFPSRAVDLTGCQRPRKFASERLREADSLPTQKHLVADVERLAAAAAGVRGARDGLGVARRTLPDA